VNIWSHLLGAFGFGALAGYASFTFLQRYPTSSPADIAVFACFFGGAVTCLGMSASVHPPLLLTRVDRGLVSYDIGAFTSRVEFRIEIGLCGHYNLDYWVFLPKCILWFLLFSSPAKNLLVDGILVTVCIAEIDHWTGDIVDVPHP